MGSLEKIIELEHVSVTYNHHVVLDDISFAIYNNDFLGLLGPIGSGKTTLIKILTGLIQPNNGKVIFPSNNKRLNIGYLPQKLPLIINSPATVKEVIDTGLFSSSLFTTKDSEKKIQQVVKDIGIEDLLEEKLTGLSGGQIQLVFLARAIVDQPDIVILDEPISNVDPKTQSKIFSILSKTNSKNIPVVFSSHDTFAITKFANRVACINKKLDFHGKSQDFLSNKHLKETYGYNVNVVSHKEHE